MHVRAYTKLRLSAPYEVYPLEPSYEADRPDFEGAEPDGVGEAMFNES